MAQQKKKHSSKAGKVKVMVSLAVMENNDTIHGGIKKKGLAYPLKRPNQVSALQSENNFGEIRVFSDI